jgi:hypothetical protein
MLLTLSIAPLYDVLSLSNFKLGDAVYHIYPTELEIKDTTDTARSASYFDMNGNQFLSTERYILHM